MNNDKRDINYKFAVKNIKNPYYKFKVENLFGLVVLSIDFPLIFMGFAMIDDAIKKGEPGYLALAVIILAAFSLSMLFCIIKMKKMSYASKIGEKLSKSSETFVIIDIETMRKVHECVKGGYLQNCTTIFYNYIPYIVLNDKKYKTKCPYCAANVLDISNPFYKCEYCKNKVVKEINLKDIN